LQRDIDELNKEKQRLCDEIDEEIKTKVQQKQKVDRELEENLKMIRKLERDISQARKTKESIEKQMQALNESMQKSMMASALNDFRAASKEMEGVLTQQDKATGALSRLEKQLQEIQAR
jgi:predicted RNase H-like nuclease (RuvC/YqgF family)